MKVIAQLTARRTAIGCANSFNRYYSGPKRHGAGGRIGATVALLTRLGRLLGGLLLAVSSLATLLGIIGSHHRFSPRRSGENLWTVTIIPICGVGLVGWLLLAGATGPRIVATMVAFGLAMSTGLTGVVLRKRAAGTLLPSDVDLSVGFRGGQGGL